MKARLGIDTGGTFTDAVLLDEAGDVIAAAKSETTRHSLINGIRKAVRAVLAERVLDIELVGLSTTLATNAIVEGQGGRVGLLLIGFGPDAMARAGLREALRGDPWRTVSGGHDAHGLERHTLDTVALRLAIEEMRDQVDAIAITSAFAVRNPSHEIAAADLVREVADLPVTMSHELTARLDGPRRALTTVLNARLVPEITRLLAAVEALNQDLGIKAPVMVVRGDGSLMRAEVVRHRPVETILSGPAASVVGAARLAQLPAAIVSDVGGTTTDIALLDDGRPRLDGRGALVGGFRTMVEAIELRTSGLGGDSRLHCDEHGRLCLGPERHVPLSLLAHDHPEIIGTLEAQAGREQSRELDARFVRLVRTPEGTVGRSQAALLRLLADGPRSLEQVIEREHLDIPLKRMVERGYVALSGFTPSDAAHCLGLQETWDASASMLGARLEARKRPLAEAMDAEHLARLVLRLARQASAMALVEAASAADGDPIHGWRNNDIYRHATDPEAEDRGVLGLRLNLNRPIVAVGGPAALFYPLAAERLASELVLPERYDVCNAIGAVSGDVVRRMGLSVTQTAEERYACQLGRQRIEGDDAEALAAQAKEWLEVQLRNQLVAAGGVDAEIELSTDVRKATLEPGREMIVEIALAATARGRPSAVAVGP